MNQSAPQTGNLNEKDKIAMKIDLCFDGEENYRKHSKGVKERVGVSDKNYITPLCDKILNIFKNKKEDGLKKFLALYVLKLVIEQYSQLIKECMDTKNPDLREAVSKNLLKKIGEMAKDSKIAVIHSTKDDKGKTRQSDLTEDFVRLLRESLFMWNQWFGLDDAKKPTQYQKTYNSLSDKEKIDPSEKLIFFVEKKNKSADRDRNKDKPQEPAAQDKQRDLQAAAAEFGKPNKKKDDLPASSRREQEQIDEAMFRTQPPKKESGNPTIRSLQRKLKQIQENKDLLLQNLQGNIKTPDDEVLQIILGELKSADKELKGSINDLFMLEDVPDKEELTDKVLRESDLITHVIAQYNGYRKGDKDYGAFRKAAMDLIGQNETPGQPEAPLKKDTDRPKASSRNEQPLSQEGRGFDFNFATVSQGTKNDFSTGFDGFDKFNTVPANTGNTGVPSGFDNPFESKQESKQEKRKTSFPNFESENAFNKKPEDAFSSSVSNKQVTQSFPDFSAIGQQKMGPIFGDEPEQPKVKSIKSIKEEPMQETAKETPKPKLTQEPSNKWDSVWGQPVAQSQTVAPQTAGKKDGGFGFDDFENYDGKNDSMDNSQVGGFNFDYDSNKQSSKKDDIFDFGKQEPPSEIRATKSDRLERPDEYSERGRRDAVPETSQVRQNAKNNISSSFDPPPKNTSSNFGAFGGFSGFEPSPIDTKKVDKQVQQQQANIEFGSPFEPQERDNSVFSTGPGNLGGGGAAIARSIIASKYEELESDRLRRERDGVLSELEKAKREYNALKVEYDYMKRDHTNMSLDMDRLKSELGHLKKINIDSNATLEQLKIENDNFKKLKQTLVAENESHLRQMEELYREIGGLKEKIADHDAKEKKYRNDAKIQELESILRSTQDQFSTMQELYNKLSREYEQANQELERVKSTNLKEVAVQMTENLQNIIGNNLSHNSDLKNIVGSALVELKRNYLLDPAVTTSTLDRSYTQTLTQSNFPITSSHVGTPFEDPQLAHANQVLENARRARQERVMTPPKRLEIGSTYEMPRLDFPGLGYSTKTNWTPPRVEVEKKNYSPMKIDSGQWSYLPPREFERRVYSPAKEVTEEESQSIATEPKANEVELPKRQAEHSRSRSEFIPIGEVNKVMASTEFKKFTPITLEQHKPLPSLDADIRDLKRFAPVNSEQPKQITSEQDLKRLLSPINLEVNPPQIFSLQSPAETPFTHPMTFSNPVDPQLQRASDILAQARKLREEPKVENRNQTPDHGVRPLGQYNNNMGEERPYSHVNTMEPKLGNTGFSYKENSLESETLPSNENVKIVERFIPNGSKNGFGINTSQTFQTFHVAEATQSKNVSVPSFSGQLPSEKIRDDDRNMKKLSFKGGRFNKDDDNSLQNMSGYDFQAENDMGSHRRFSSQNVEFVPTLQSRNKQKVGKTLRYDSALFDQVANSILNNPIGRDVDSYKYSCLVNRAALVDSNILQVGLISRLENTSNDAAVKLMLHFGNKTTEPITNFTVEVSATGVLCTPKYRNGMINSKSQVKQEIFCSFANAKYQSQNITISFQQNGMPTRIVVPLPLTPNKFFTAKKVDASSLKSQWKNLKKGAVKLGYRTLNSKFIKTPADVTKFFEGSMTELSSHKKHKFAGVFSLPDGHDYIVRLHLDRLRLKVFVASKNQNSKFCEWIAQYLGFLLTL